MIRDIIIVGILCYLMWKYIKYKPRLDIATNTVTGDKQLLLWYNSYKSYPTTREFIILFKITI